MSRLLPPIHIQGAQERGVGCSQGSPAPAHSVPDPHTSFPAFTLLSDAIRNFIWMGMRFTLETSDEFLWEAASLWKRLGNVGKISHLNFHAHCLLPVGAVVFFHSGSFWLFQQSTFYFSIKRFYVFFCPQLALGASCTGLSVAQRVLSGFPLTCSLLWLYSQEERGRRGWWHERAGSLGRNHVTTAAPGWKKDFGYLFWVQMCFVEEKVLSKMSFIFNFNPEQWELHCCFLHSMEKSLPRGEKGEQGNCPAVNTVEFL